MLPLMLAACLALPQEAPAPPAPAPASAAPAPAPAPAPAAPKPLAFYSGSFHFAWNTIIPLDVEVDGLKVKRIFFDNRQVDSRFLGFLKNATFGTRAQLEVTNTSKFDKVPGFAVAVLDKDGQLLGVASGGTKLGTVGAGTTETFDLNFSQVKERLPKGDRFILAIELRN